MQLQVGLEDPGTTGPDGPAYSPAGRHGWIDAADAVGAFLFLEGAFLFLEGAFLFLEGALLAI